MEDIEENKRGERRGTLPPLFLPSSLIPPFPYFLVLPTSLFPHHIKFLLRSISILWPISSSVHLLSLSPLPFLSDPSLIPPSFPPLILPSSWSHSHSPSIIKTSSFLPPQIYHPLFFPYSLPLSFLNHSIRFDFLLQTLSNLLSPSFQKHPTTPFSLFHSLLIFFLPKQYPPFWYPPSTYSIDTFSFVPSAIYGTLLPPSLPPSVPCHKPW